MLEEALLESGGFDGTQRELLGLTDRLLTAIETGDADTYASLCADDLSCFEDVCRHRIDGVGFHLHLVERASGADPRCVRHDLLSPRVQVYGDASIVTYTRLITRQGDDGPEWSAFNETRVFVRLDGAWKMVHFHRSPA